MKSFIKLLPVIFLFSTTSCHAQRMVQTVNDAKKLEVNKEQFIGKPLKELLYQIGPKIKYAYGTPDNRWSERIGGTYIKFFFLDKNSVKKRANKNPTGITVRFMLEPENTRKPIPVGGENINTDEIIKEYGDMIVLGIYVSGEN